MLALQQRGGIEQCGIYMGQFFQGSDEQQLCMVILREGLVEQKTNAGEGE